jgi:DNA repair protein RecN (Recombination protein N)
MEAGERKRRIDYLKYAVNEIEEFEPEDSEFEELNRIKAVIQNSGRYFSDLSSAYSGLRDEESSVLDVLSHMESQLEFHLEIRPELEEPLSHLRESVYRLEMLADFLRNEKDSTQFSPEQLEDIDERIADYKKLHKKYGGNTASMINMLEDFRKELIEMEMTDEEAELLQSELEVHYNELHAAGEDLSRKRSFMIPVLEEKLASELSDLGMEGASIHISVKREVDPELSSEGRICYAVNEKGLDRVEFLLRANLGERIQPLRKIASGGELSRIMLAIKSIIIDNNPVSVVVFDEIDTGVGGEVAHAIGARLKAISRKSQVMVVTHLHQIASLGDQHFRISKEVKEGRTLTQLQRLQGEKRLEELTRMLGGGAFQGSAVMEHARELLSRQVS